MNKLNFAELNKRADEMFLLDEGDMVISVDGEKILRKLECITKLADLNGI